MHREWSVVRRGGREVALKIIVKYLCVFTALTVAIFGYVNRYKSVNEEIKNPPVFEYIVGDWVDMDDNFLINYTMKGYSLRVIRSEVLSYEDFLKKYEIEDEYSYVPDRVYNVEIELRNKDAKEDVGVNLAEFYVQGLAVCAGIDTDLLSQSNPVLKGEYAIALKKDTSIKINMPFALYKENFRSDVWDNLESFDMDFVATLYPIKKVIGLTNKMSL